VWGSTFAPHTFKGSTFDAASLNCCVPCEQQTAEQLLQTKQTLMLVK